MPEKDRDTKNNAPQGQAGQMVHNSSRTTPAPGDAWGPLKGAGRWIALGLVGALLIGTATGFLVLGTLRLVQTEWPGTFQGRWAQLAPYAFGLLFCAIVAGLAFRRINKQPLTKEKR